MAQVNDDFSDGDFTNNPTWIGDAADFTVNTNFELQLDAPAVTSEKYLVTSSQAINNTTWEFSVRMTFNPSSSNKANIYLVSDQQDLNGSLNGYYVQIGNTSDEISLYKQNGTSRSKIIDGTDDVVDINPVEARIRVTRDALGNWELLHDVGFTGTFTSEGSTFDDDHMTTNWFGFHCDYTSTRSNRFFFDDVSVQGIPFSDTIPPSLDSIATITNQYLVLIFNERLDSALAVNPNMYSIDQGIGNPNTVLVSQGDVLLDFGPVFSPLTPYILTIDSVQDTSGNVLRTTVPFQFFTQPQTQFEDVIINEIMADPAPVVGLPEAEYIELYNTTAQPINLENWTYTDGSTTTATLPEFFLGSDAYVILCKDDDTLSFQGFGDVIGLSSWPSLNNTRDELGLRNENNDLIDTLEYTDDWYQESDKSDGGYSLERINPAHPCSDPLNWKASSNTLGGTPGVVNSIYNNAPDSIIPEIIDFQIINLQTLRFTYNKGLDANASQIICLVSPNVSLDSIAFISNYEIDVLLNSSLDSGAVYTARITGGEDCFGNQQGIDTTDFAIGRIPEPYEIIISELSPNPDNEITNLPEAEYVEIYNSSAEALLLQDMYLHDEGDSVIIPNGTILPKSYLILVEDRYEDLFASNTHALSSFPSLNNAGDDISIRFSDGTIMDRVAYTDDWYQDEEKAKGGYSIEKWSLEAKCLGAINWSGSETALGGTPGTENSIDLNISVDTPKITAWQFVDENTLLTVWNRDILIDSNLSISSSPSLVWYDSISSTTNEITFYSKSNISESLIYALEISGVNQCDGRSISTQYFQSILPGNQSLVVNEVLFNPLSGGSDYVELTNNEEIPVNIYNYQLRYINTNREPVYKPVSEQHLFLNPGDYICFTENSIATINDYPISAPENIFETDLPTYSNESGQVILTRADSLVIDSFSYNADMHFGLVKDADGVALERINPFVNTNQTLNWTSAAESVYGGTPGIENSQYLESQNGTSTISLEPKTFSPDNDGWNDVLSINYQVAQNGFTASVWVYNKAGVMVKELVNNELLETKGSWYWDGTNDDGNMVDTGPYIIFVRMMDLENNSFEFKEVSVVAIKN